MESGKPLRLQKFLSRSGVASRRASERLILAGRVAVNGVVVDILGAKVDPEHDAVAVDGRAVQLAEPRWVVLHKPRGFVTTASDPQGRPTVFDLLPSDWRSLRHVGRLDLDTEGLLILTNQGDVAERLLHPRFQVEREYRIWVASEPGAAVLERLMSGVRLDDGPARAKLVALAGPSDTEGVPLTLVLTEGRKREVRRMMEAVGNPVRRLRRVRFGPVRLGDLGSGAWREMEPAEVQALRHFCEEASVEPVGG